MAWTNILCKNSTHVYMRLSASESLSFSLSDRILPTGPALDMVQRLLCIFHVCLYILTAFRYEVCIGYDNNTKCQFEIWIITCDIKQQQQENDVNEE